MLLNLTSIIFIHYLFNICIMHITLYKVIKRSRRDVWPVNEENIACPLIIMIYWDDKLWEVKCLSNIIEELI